MEIYMNELIAKVLTGKVTDENDDSYFVQIEGTTFTLDKAEIKKPLKLGSMFTGFTYENEQHKLQITRTAPAIRRDHYGFATVVKQHHGLGVFVNIGLPNKDVVVSLDELPTMTDLWPKEGDKLMIDLGVDNKGRIWGHLADEEIFQAISQQPKKVVNNKPIKGIAYRLKMAGTRILTTNYELAFLHPDERIQEPRLGEVVEGRIIGQLRDQTINMTTKPKAYKAIGDDAEMVLAVLQHSADGELPYSDKSDPEDIKTFFGISKGAFKRALGHLLKERLITQEDGKIILKDRD